MSQFDVEDLKRILRSGAGVAEQVDLDSEGAIDRTFADLGYDSLAVMELASRIQREYGLDLPDGEVEHTHTLREAAAAVNARLVEAGV